MNVVLDRPLAEEVSEPRIYGPFPALLKGVDALGHQLEGETVLDDLSATDFTLRLGQPVDVGAELLVVIRLHGALVAVRSVISKVEQQAEGPSVVRASIVHSRFLS